MEKQSKIIAYREKGHLLLGVVLENKGKKLLLLSEENKKGNISPEKIEYYLDKNLSLDAKDFEIARELKYYREHIDEQSESIELEDLYDLLREEEEGYNAKSLTELTFSEDPSTEKVLSMAFRLDGDQVYFKLKNELYYPKPYKLVKEQIEERERSKLSEEKKQREAQIAYDWLKEFISNSTSENILPPPVEVLKLLEPIKQYIIFRDLYEKKKLALDLVSQIKMECGLKIDNPIEGMYNFFIDIGVFQEDVNLSLLKYHTPLTFSDKALESINESKGFSEEDYKGRKDYRHLYTITIDDADSKDLDDALTFEDLGDSYSVGVHISDASYFIAPGSILDQEALNRGMTVYLPIEKISMLPEALSEDKMSLVEGEVRPTISFMILFDRDLQILDHEVHLSIISVDKRMTYESVDESIEKVEGERSILEKLYDIAIKLQSMRESQGAVEFKNPDVKVRIDEDGKVYLKAIHHELKSFLIVKEFMIYANHIAARYCQDHGIPAVYIGQDPPDEPIVLDDNIRNHKHLLLEQLKKMKKAEMDSYPRRHFALGLDSYTQSTSPIRRYHDLIIHRQIKEFILKGSPYYSVEEIQKVAATADRASKEVKGIERETTRYWLLKYLKQEKSRTFKAVVTRKLSNGYLTEIKEVFVQAILITPAHLDLGQEVDVMIHRVNPLLDVLHIKRAN